jgi:hypothetical protein
MAIWKSRNKDGGSDPRDQRPAWQTGEPGRRLASRRVERAGFWGWIGQAMSQLRDALQGGSQPWQGP